MLDDAAACCCLRLLLTGNLTVEGEAWHHLVLCISWQRAESCPLMCQVGSDKLVSESHKENMTPTCFPSFPICSVASSLNSVQRAADSTCDDFGFFLLCISQSPHDLSGGRPTSMPTSPWISSLSARFRGHRPRLSNGSRTETPSSPATTSK